LATTNSDNNSKRLNYASGSKWEDIVGYSRAVRVGNIIEIAGTTAVDEHGNIHGENNAYEQTTYILKKIDKFLTIAGASMNQVVRTRIFVTDISLWEEIGKAHGAFFKDIKPAATMVEVSKLISPELLVEIEATAIITEP
jgi:enamine deaminase RidA (YjgF/YER057c/UK114 family)